MIFIRRYLMNIIQKVDKYYIRKFYKYLRLLLIRYFGIGRPKTKSKWDEEYFNGKWNYLLSDAINEKNTLITSIAFSKFQNPKILDIGCGNGALLQSIKKEKFGYYLGIDKSEIALELINQELKDLNNVELLAKDIDEIDFKNYFDCVIFNEVLYYISKPINTLKRVLNYVNKESIIIISMTQNPNNKKIWENLNKIISEVNRFEIKTSHKSISRISIYQPFE